MIINDRLIRGWRGDSLALISGLLLPLAFAPFGIWPLAVISLLLVMWSWWDTTPGRAFRRGWLYGIGMFGFGVSWVHVSMHYFGGVSVPLSVFLTALFVMFLALFPALIAYCSRKLFPHYGKNHAFKFIAIIPLLWVFTEWVRSWLFTGFPWLNLGYSQIDSPLAGFAPVFGVYGISYAVALSAGLLLYAAHFPASIRKTIPALAMLWIIPGLLLNVDWSTPIDEPIKVSMIQGNISQDQKWLAENRLPQIEMYADLSREHWDSNLIIWPETAVPAYYHQAKPYLDTIAQEARMNRSEILLGIAVYTQHDKKYYNSMVSIGNEEGSYEKRHLVPFGEYLPLPGLLNGFIDFFNIPMSDFSPGKDSDKPILKVAGQKAGISICYEDVFGEEVIQALPEATFLVNTSNDAWFGDSIAPHQHMEIARMRALETGRYMLRSTNTGVSAAIDPKGKIVAASPQFQRDVLTTSIQPMTGMSVYAVFGNVLIMTLVIFGLLALIIQDWYKRKPAKA